MGSSLGWWLSCRVEHFSVVEHSSGFSSQSSLSLPSSSTSKSSLKPTDCDDSSSLCFWHPDISTNSQVNQSTFIPVNKMSNKIGGKVNLILKGVENIEDIEASDSIALKWSWVSCCCRRVGEWDASTTVDNEQVLSFSIMLESKPLARKRYSCRKSVTDIIKHTRPQTTL